MSASVTAALRAALFPWLAFSLAGTAVASQQTDGLEEVVVTAQFRSESLQETPIAISAFTGEILESRNLANVTDLDSFVPNTVLQPLGAGWGATLAAFIRGVGLGDNILSFEPGVPIYVDDVYMGRPQGSIFDLLDLERVEVLRGPQGTLFGKNAIGGTVRSSTPRARTGFVKSMPARPTSGAWRPSCRPSRWTSCVSRRHSATSITS